MRARHGELEEAAEGNLSLTAASPSGPGNSWRVFCAIDLPESVHARFRRHIAQLREIAPHSKASWTRDANVHLTVKFLGDTDHSRVSLLSQAADRAVTKRPPFRIVIERAGSFPKSGAPKVLWIGISDPSGGLLALQQHFEEECAKAGFDREERPFHPHLTIARLHLPQASRGLAAAHLKISFEPIEVIVSELRVIRSQLSSKGSQYTVLSRHPLSNSG